MPEETLCFRLAQIVTETGYPASEPIPPEMRARLLEKWRGKECAKWQAREIVAAFWSDKIPTSRLISPKMRARVLEKELEEESAKRRAREIVAAFWSYKI